jgi:hypothetical protein
MPQVTRVICFTAALVAVTACGSQNAVTGPGSTTAPTSVSQPSVFPLTITRTGGIAGFQDVLVVARDGMVSITRRAQARRQCRLTPDAVERLTKAASQVPWARITPASTAPSFPDDLVAMVRSPAGGPVRLEDPKVGAGGQVFNELLNDLLRGAAGSRMCTPA